MTGMFGNILNVVQMFKRFAKNPIGELVGMGMNIPQNINGDPEAVVNYLRNSGKMTNDQFEQCKELTNEFGSFLPNQSK